MNNSIRPFAITGVTGFIGSRIARAILDQRREVCLLDIRTPSLETRASLGRRTMSARPMTCGLVLTAVILGNAAIAAAGGTHRNHLAFENFPFEIVVPSLN